MTRRLQQQPIIPAKGSNVTAYFLYDTHYAGRDGINNPDPRALKCQVAVYRQLEELYWNQRIGQVFVEAGYKGVSFIDVIKAHVPNYERSVARTFEGTRKRFKDDGELTSFILHAGGHACAAFGVNYVDRIPVFGWEGTPPAELDEEHKKLFYKVQALNAVEQKIRQGIIKQGTSEYDDYDRGKKEVDEEGIANRKRRSVDAYFNSLEFATQNPTRNPNYAVIVGKAHREDILEIIVAQEQHPRIVDFVWI